MQTLDEVGEFVTLVQRQYAEAFETDDTDGMFETSFALTRLYSLMGNIPLAGRWARECEKHTGDPSRILAVNMLLICGIIKQKYSKC